MAIRNSLSVATFMPGTSEFCSFGIGVVCLALPLPGTQ